jgi:hypothetical protein
MKPDPFGRTPSKVERRGHHAATEPATDRAGLKAEGSDLYVRPASPRKLDDADPVSRIVESKVDI